MPRFIVDSKGAGLTVCPKCKNHSVDETGWCYNGCTTLLWIATVRFPAKRQGYKTDGKCYLGARCTDVFGAHHSFLVEARNPQDAYTKALDVCRKLKAKWVTRIERAVTLEPSSANAKLPKSFSYTNENGELRCPEDVYPWK